MDKISLDINSMQKNVLEECLDEGIASVQI
jgi:hypothetical protein